MMNLHRLLENAPDGLVMYSPAYGEVKVYRLGIEHDKEFRLERNLPFGGTIGYLDCYGRIFPEGQCMLFPDSNCTWANWPFVLMIQKPCTGAIVYDLLNANLYKIIKPYWFETQDGRQFHSDYLNTLRFATEEEVNRFARKSKLYSMYLASKNLKPGDLVLVREVTNAIHDSVWKLGHFSHYDKARELYITTEISAIGNFGYKECVPYTPVTKSMLNTEKEMHFVNDDDDTPSLTVNEFTAD